MIETPLRLAASARSGHTNTTTAAIVTSRVRSPVRRTHRAKHGRSL